MYGNSVCTVTCEMEGKLGRGQVDSGQLRCNSGLIYNCTAITQGCLLVALVKIGKGNECTLSVPVTLPTFEQKLFHCVQQSVTLRSKL